MSIAFSSEMLVKRKSTSWFPMREFRILFNIEWFTAYSLLVKGFKIGTRNFANL